MALDGLRARLEQLLADAGQGDARGRAEALYRALVDTKAAIAQMRHLLDATSREAAMERQRLEDAERRGRLAAEIPDRETVDLAELWTAKHRERLELLERKQRVQEDELRLAERQLEELSRSSRQAGIAGAPGAGPSGPEAPGPDPELERARWELERQARETRVREQLADLKRKLGRQD